MSGRDKHLPLYRFPYKQDFASAEGTDVMDAFDEYGVFKMLSNVAGVVLDALG
jgi:hypothetical protein